MRARRAGWLPGWWAEEEGWEAVGAWERRRVRRSMSGWERSERKNGIGWRWLWEEGRSAGMVGKWVGWMRWLVMGGVGVWVSSAWRSRWL